MAADVEHEERCAVWLRPDLGGPHSLRDHSLRDHSLRDHSLHVRSW